MRAPSRAAVVLAGLGLALPAAAERAREDYTREFAKTVPLAAGRSVRIEHRQGNVRVRTHALAEARIQARIRVSADDRAAAAAFGEGIEIVVDPGPSVLTIRTRYPTAGRRSNASYAVDYDVTIPEAAPLTVQNRFGSLDVAGLKAPADLDNAHGSLTFRDGRGAQHLANSFGTIEVAGNVGDVTVANSNASLTVSDVEGSLQARNRFGTVTARRIQGAAGVVNSNGAVELATVGGTANVTNSFGTVTLTGVTSAATV